MDAVAISQEVRQWLTLAAIIVPSGFSAYSAVLTYRARRDIAALEVNTNSKMDKLLAASVGEAAAVGEKKGRDDEVARVAALPAS